MWRDTELPSLWPTQPRHCPGLFVEYMFPRSLTVYRWPTARSEIAGRSAAKTMCDQVMNVPISCWRVHNGLANYVRVDLFRLSKPRGRMNMRLVFGIALALGPFQAALAQGPAGSTGAIASIPGSIVRWQPGDPVPSPGLFSILTSPSPRYQLPPEPVRRETKVRKQ